MEDAQARLSKHNISSLTGNISGSGHRDADVSYTEGRRIVDTIADEADNVPSVLECKYNTRFLCGIDSGEDRVVFYGVGKSTVRSSGQYPAL